MFRAEDTGYIFVVSGFIKQIRPDRISDRKNE